MIVFASPNLHFIEIQCNHTVVKAIIIISIYNLGTKCQTPSNTKSTKQLMVIVYAYVLNLPLRLTKKRYCFPFAFNF